ncbi:hypothetical protein PIB30_077017, partial [Stylosanthes scabra]|nr:hypothetical protein [Stylosanthes scabra]
MSYRSCKLIGFDHHALHMLDHHLKHEFQKHARIEGDGTSFEWPQTARQSELWVKSYRDRKSPMNSGEL